MPLKLVLILAVLVTVGKTETPRTLNAQEKIDISRRLSSFLGNAGFTFSAYTEHYGFSLIATKDFAPGDIMIEIPAAITISSFDEFEWTPVIETMSFGQSVWKVAFTVTLRLLFEKFTRFDLSDPINAYVHSLPEEYDNPALWLEENQQFLKSRILHEFPRNELLSFKDGLKLYQTFLEKLDDTQQRSMLKNKKAWEWAYGAFSTRAYKQTYYEWKQQHNIQSTEEDKDVGGIAMMPVFDLVNHWPTQNYDAHNHFGMKTGEGIIVMFADRPIKAGTQMMTEYSKEFSNFVLLHHYGFVIDRHCNEYFVIEVPKTRRAKCSDAEKYGVCSIKVFPCLLSYELLDYFRGEALRGKTAVPNILEGNILAYARTLPGLLAQDDPDVR